MKSSIKINKKRKRKKREIHSHNIQKDIFISKTRGRNKRDANKERRQSINKGP